MAGIKTSNIEADYGNYSCNNGDNIGIAIDIKIFGNSDIKKLEIRN